MKARLVVLPFALMGYTLAGAQVPLTPAPVFEVASVKRNLSGSAGSSIQVPPAGTVTFINVALRILIRNAYQLEMEQFTLVQVRLPEEPDLCAGLRGLWEGTSLIVPLSMPLAFLKTSNGS